MVFHPHPCRCQEWIPRACWTRVLALQALPRLRDLASGLVRQEAGWRAWFQTPAPESTPPPELGGGELSPLHCVLLCWALREERSSLAAERCVEAVLGPRFLDAAPPAPADVLLESTPASPIICLLSSGDGALVCEWPGRPAHRRAHARLPLTACTMRSPRFPPAHAGCRGARACREQRPRPGLLPIPLFPPFHAPLHSSTLPPTHSLPHLFPLTTQY